MRVPNPPVVVPPIIVDTREQKPYVYDNTVRTGLATGDYSLEGYTGRVAIERKSVADAYGSTGRGRARFEACFERLAALDYGAVVVECTHAGILRRPPYAKMGPAAVRQTLIGWSVKYGVPVWFAGDRTSSQQLVADLLGHFYRYDLAGQGMWN